MKLLLLFFLISCSTLQGDCSKNYSRNHYTKNNSINGKRALKKKQRKPIVIKHIDYPKEVK